MRPGAVALAAVLTLMQAALVAAQEETGEDEARRQYDRGQALEGSGDLAGALEAYRLAQELRPAFRLHRHIGRVALALGRYREALESFERFLEEGGDRVEAAHRQEAAEAIAEARGHLAALTVSAPPGAALALDGAPLGRAPLAGSIVVEEGRHRLVATLEGHREQGQDVIAVGREPVEVVVSLEPLAAPGEPDFGPGGEEPATPPPEEPEPPAPRAALESTWFWVAASVAAATLVTGTLLGGLTLQRQAEFDDLNRPDRTDRDDARLEDLRGSGEALALATDVILFAGAALAVSSLVLALFTDFGRSHEGAAAALRPTLAASGLALCVEGGF